MSNEKIFKMFDSKFIGLWVTSTRHSIDATRRPELEDIGRTWRRYVRSIGAEIVSLPSLCTFGFERVDFGHVAPDRSSIVVSDPHALRNFDREDLYILMDSELAAKILTVGLP